jgi:hypothetical protein
MRTARRSVDFKYMGALFMEKEPLIPKHDGYRKLKSFQVAQLVYDVTVRRKGKD